MGEWESELMWERVCVCEGARASQTVMPSTEQSRALAEDQTSSQFSRENNIGFHVAMHVGTNNHGGKLWGSSTDLDAVDRAARRQRCAVMRVNQRFERKKTARGTAFCELRYQPRGLAVWEGARGDVEEDQDERDADDRHLGREVQKPFVEADLALALVEPLVGYSDVAVPGQRGRRVARELEPARAREGRADHDLPPHTVTAHSHSTPSARQ